MIYNMILITLHEKIIVIRIMKKKKKLLLLYYNERAYLNKKGSLMFMVVALTVICLKLVFFLCLYKI